MKICSVCKGSGLVKDKNFIGGIGGYTMFETCEACNGVGYIK